MDLNINDELVTKYYDLKEERKKLYDAIIERKVKEASEESLKQGIQQGIEQGIQENKKEIILNMHNKNMSYEDIAELTNLKVSEVKEIINNLVNEKESA